MILVALTYAERYNFISRISGDASERPGKGLVLSRLNIRDFLKGITDPKGRGSISYTCYTLAGAPEGDSFYITYCDF